MESITIKVDEALAKEMNAAIEPYFSTKTEFIREAIRDKLKRIKKEKAVDELREYLGKAKTKTSNAEEREIRKKIGKEFAEKFGVKLN